MAPEMVPIGYGNIVSANRIMAIAVPSSAPIKRLVSEKKEQGLVIDATSGRKTRSVIFTDSGHVILSALNPESIYLRLKRGVTESGGGA